MRSGRRRPDPHRRARAPAGSRPRRAHLHRRRHSGAQRSARAGHDLHRRLGAPGRRRPRPDARTAGHRRPAAGRARRRDGHPPAGVEERAGGRTADGPPRRRARHRQDPPVRRGGQARPRVPRRRPVRALRRRHGRLLPTLRRGPRSPGRSHRWRRPRRPPRPPSGRARAPRARDRHSFAGGGTADALGPRDRALPPLRRGDVVAREHIRGLGGRARARRSALGREAHPSLAAPSHPVVRPHAPARDRDLPRHRPRPGPSPVLAAR